MQLFEEALVVAFPGSQTLEHSPGLPLDCAAACLIKLSKIALNQVSHAQYRKIGHHRLVYGLVDHLRSSALGKIIGIERGMRSLRVCRAWIFQQADLKLDKFDVALFFFCQALKGSNCCRMA